jgi:hypothetical protein
MASMKAAEAARSALEASRRAAMVLVQGKGATATEAFLKESAEQLERRIAGIAPGVGEDTFTVVQMRATLAQLRHVIAHVTLPGLKAAVVDTAADSAIHGVQHTVDYLVKADRAFRGVGEQPIALREAAMLDKGVMGARASVLRRLVTGVETRKGKDAAPGILSRYGIETVGEFEKVLQHGLIQKKSWIEMRQDLTDKSPFLQGKPKYWAHRIVRTEVMGAHGASAQGAIVEASKTLTGMIKILSETFDDRTAADSWADHGQIRRPEESFENWTGEFLHPPGRPNDRAIVVPHRTRWPLPRYLVQKDDDEIAEAWARDGRKGEPPDRPLMSTVPGFGEDA